MERNVGYRAQGKLLVPYNHNPGKTSHYYQEKAINRAVEATSVAVNVACLH